MADQGPSSHGVAKVLVLNTGGTISMIIDPENPDRGLVPAKNKFKKLCEEDPSLNDDHFRKQQIKKKKLGEHFLVLPATNSFGAHDRRVAYCFEEYENLIDSSNMNVKYWETICRDIRDNYGKFDGFVILHGTDTMAYTASALSFMLTNLHKSVILTGAQKPIFETRTDGRNNFVSAILIAGLEVVPEVTIFFHERLLRGNRCIKRSAEGFFGFDSCNVPPIMTFGVGVEINYCNMVGERKGDFRAHLEMNDNVSILRIFPSISTKAIEDALGEPYKGIVLYTYGAGNIPTDRKDLLKAIKAAVDRGAIVVNCTQCPFGGVAGIYATGTILEEMGVISGHDMTVEAALAKLMFVLSMKRRPLHFKKRMMNTVLRGEMTVSRVEQQIALRKAQRSGGRKLSESQSGDTKVKTKPKRSTSITEEKSASDSDSNGESDAETRREKSVSDVNISDGSQSSLANSLNRYVVNVEYEIPTHNRMMSGSDKSVKTSGIGKKRRRKN